MPKGPCAVTTWSALELQALAVLVGLMAAGELLGTGVTSLPLPASQALRALSSFCPLSAYFFVLLLGMWPVVAASDHHGFPGHTLDIYVPIAKAWERGHLISFPRSSQLWWEQQGHAVLVGMGERAEA